MLDSDAHRRGFHRQSDDGAFGAGAYLSKEAALLGEALKLTDADFISKLMMERLELEQTLMSKKRGMRVSQVDIENLDVNLDVKPDVNLDLKPSQSEYCRYIYIYIYIDTSGTPLT